MTMGDRGRLVVPADLRDRAGLREGDTLVLIDAGTGIALLTRAQLKALVRRQLEGADLVADLLEERRRASAADDAA